ncbi:MAG: alkaline phosphatase D family protein [Maioricimonas sp. JB045]
MFLRLSRLCLFTILSPLVASSTAVADEPQPVERIAFGSCAKQDQPQPIWDAIVNAEPELFLFIGDNIYGDSEDVEVLRAKWNQLGAVPGYRQLKQTCPVLATWDDHDYGVNDGGAEFPRKRESQQLFLEFFEEPAGSPRWNREGVYDAKVYGPAGKRVQVILLDTRYHRSRLVRRDWRPEPGEGDMGPYGPNNDPEATMLGAEQWAWLEEQLRQPAELRIIASSIQVIPNGHHWEKWGNFPRERQRLFDLIGKTGAGGVIFVSGDRHSAEISAFDPGVGYDLIDVTSSSLNRPSKWHTELNPHRIGTKYTDENFGMIAIDWDQEDPVVRCQVCSIEGEVVLQHRVPLSQLQPASKN